MKPVDVSGVFWCWVPERKQVRRLSAQKDRPPPHYFNANVPVSKGEEDRGVKDACGIIQENLSRLRRRRSLYLLCAAHARQASHCPEFDSPATFCAAAPEWRLKNLAERPSG